MTDAKPILVVYKDNMILNWWTFHSIFSRCYSVCTQTRAFHKDNSELHTIARSLNRGPQCPRSNKRCKRKLRFTETCTNAHAHTYNIRCRQWWIRLGCLVANPAQFIPFPHSLSFSLHFQIILPYRILLYPHPLLNIAGKRFQFYIAVDVLRIVIERKQASWLGFRYD